MRLLPCWILLLLYAGQIQAENSELINADLSSESIITSALISKECAEAPSSDSSTEAPTIIEKDEENLEIPRPDLSTSNAATTDELSSTEASATDVTSSLESSPQPKSLVAPEIIISFNATNLNDLVNENISNSTENLFLSFEEWKKVKEEDAALSVSYTASAAKEQLSSSPTPVDTSSLEASCSLNSETLLVAAAAAAASSEISSLSPQLSSLLEDLDYSETNSITSTSESPASTSFPSSESESTGSGSSCQLETSPAPESIVEADVASGSVDIPSEEASEPKDHIDIDPGKVYKDKFNYASSDCAATIVKTNNNAKGASAILVENKDSYLLNQCSILNKFVVIELCQDILVDSVVVGNFEFFSSMFRNLKFSVSDRFPTQTWEVLGHFEQFSAGFGTPL